MPRFITEWKAWSTGDVVAGSGCKRVNWVRQGGPMVNEDCHPSLKKALDLRYGTGLAFFLYLQISYYVNPMGSTCEFLPTIIGWVRWEVSQWQSPAYRSILPMRSWLNSQDFEVAGETVGNPGEGVSVRMMMKGGFFDASVVFWDPWKLAYHHKICIISDVSNMELWSKFMDWNVSTYWSNMIWPKLCGSFLYLEASLRFLDP